MKSNWFYTTLGDICTDIFSGGTPNTKIDEYWHGELNWLSSGETRKKFIWDTEKKITQIGVENSSTKLARKEDIVIASAGQGFTRGHTAICMVDTYINQSIIALRVDRTKADPYFLYYNLSGRYDELRHLSDAHSSRGSLTTKILKDIEIYLPPLEEQKRLSKILLSLDNKINLNIKIIYNLEKIVETLFKRWFVEFEFPNKNGDSFKSSGGEFTDSELGLIPSNWTVATMGSFLLPKSKRVGELIITEYSTTNSGIQLRNEKFNKKLTNNSSKNKIIEKNDIVFGMSREILNFGVMKERIGAVSPAYHVFSVNCEVFEAELLEMYMRIQSDQFLSLIKPGAREGQGLDKNHLKIKKIIVPNKEIQNKFNSIFFTIKKKINAITNEVNLINDIKNSLLPKIMTGEFEVPLIREEEVHVQV